MVSIAAFGAIGLVMPLPEKRTCTATTWPRRKVWNVILTVIHSFICSYQNSPYNNQNSISFVFWLDKFKFYFRHLEYFGMVSEHIPFKISDAD